MGIHRKFEQKGLWKSLSENFFDKIEMIHHKASWWMLSLELGCSETPPSILFFSIMPCDCIP